MGQRTAIILQHVNNYGYAAKKGEVNTRVFYHQWGIGRILPSQLVSILNGIISEHDWWGSNFAERIKPQGCIDVTNEYSEEDRSRMNNKNILSFNHPEQVGDILSSASNNNGGIFLRITTGKDGSYKAEYAYMLGYEEDGDYKNFCTFKEWAAKNCQEFIDDGFLAYYYSVLAYFDAKEMIKTKED